MDPHTIVALALVVGSLTMLAAGIAGQWRGAGR